MILLIDLYSFMEKASNTHADLVYIEERSREDSNIFTTAQKELISSMSRQFFSVMNSGTTTDSLVSLELLLDKYSMVIDELFQITNEYEYESY